MAPPSARSTLLRYLLWQAPGWLLAGVAFTLGGLVVGLPWWVPLAGVGVLVVRDIALYPAMREVFQRPSPAHPIGARGVTVEALRPEGMIRVRGELWRARAVGGALSPHEEVVVTGAQGLTLLVQRPGETPDGGDSS